MRQMIDKKKQKWY